MERGREVTSDLADVIRRRRLAKGLSQERLAADAGLHRSFIGLVESGKRGLSVAALTQIAAGLDATAWELLREAESGPPRVPDEV